MGFSISWCAVREADAAAFLADVGLASTGETEEVPESDRSSARLDTGWRLVWFNEHNPSEVSDARLVRLSADRELLLCRVEEHCMASSAEFWSRGSRTWWISHEGEDGPKGLEVDGTPPAGFVEVRAQMEREQREAGGDAADVDYIFEIPLLVARDMVGFKHDEGEDHVIDARYEVLAKRR